MPWRRRRVPGEILLRKLCGIYMAGGAACLGSMYSPTFALFALSLSAMGRMGLVVGFLDFYCGGILAGIVPRVVSVKLGKKHK